MRQQDPLPRKPKQPQPPAVPFDPNNPSTWPQATPSNLAELQAKAGYKPLTGKSTGSPVQPDTNMYNAGTMDVLRGAGNAFVKAGDFLIKTPLQSINRTASGQNLQTLVDPKSTATQRINAVGEDALNVLSFIPAFRAGGAVDDVVRYSDEGMAAAKQAYTNFRNRKTPPIPEFKLSPIQSERVRRIVNVQNADKQQLSDLMMSMTGTKPYRKEWFESIDPGKIRLWHTNRQGLPLPPKLSPMSEVARDPVRRGTGATQAFSQGLYNTNAGDMSLTYLDQLPTETMEAFPGSIIPDNMLDRFLNVPASRVDDMYGASKYPQIQQLIQKMQVDDFRNQMVGLDDLANNIPWTKNSRYKNVDFGNKTIRQVLEEADSQEAAMDIINDSLRPIVYKPKSGVERVSFKYPIIKDVDANLTKSAVVSPDTGMYLYGNHSFGQQMPFSDDFYAQIRPMAEEFSAKELAKMKSKGYGEEYIQEAMRDMYVNNPFERVLANEWYNPNFTVHRQRVGGQNYWDLDVERGPLGDIQKLGGLKAIDINSANPETFNELANNIREFVRTSYPQHSQSPALNDIINQIKNLSSAERRTRDFYDLQNRLDNLLGGFEAGQRTSLMGPELTPKEQMWQYLADKGYGVLPHTGGQITNAAETHLATNILKPELMPPSIYVPDEMRRVEDILNKISRSNAMQYRATASKGTGREYSEAMFKAALDRVRSGTARTGGQLIASSNLQRIGGY